MKIENKIILGDVLDSLKNIPENSIHLIITSPPYNLGIEYTNNSDKLPYIDYLEWLNTVWSQCKRVLVDGGRLCINMGENKRQNITYPTFSAFINQNINLGMLYRGTIIWNKNSCANYTAWGSWKSSSNPHIIPRVEYILVFSKNSFKLEGNKEDTDMTKEEFIKYTNGLWSITPESRKKIGHPAPFPVELPRRLIKLYSYKNNIVLDPFAGSGTVGVACIELGRSFILIDNSEEYCQLMKKRLDETIYNNSLLIGNTCDYSLESNKVSSR